MNRFTLGLSILLSLSLSANAQKRQSGDDASAVHSTVTNYIEAYYTGNSALMEHTLHPQYLKQKLHGSIPIRQQTAADLVQSARSGEGAQLTPAERGEQVTVLDVAGNMASAKLVTPGWTDYMTLIKIAGEWKILSVVQRIDNWIGFRRGLNTNALPYREPFLREFPRVFCAGVPDLSPGSYSDNSPVGQISGGNQKRG